MNYHGSLVIFTLSLLLVLILTLIYTYTQVGDAQDPALVRRARLGASGGGHGHGVAADNRAQPPLSQNTVKSGSGKGRSATDSRNAFVEPLTETESAPLATSSVALAASNPKSYCLQSGVPARVAGADLGRSSERWRSSGLHDDDLAMVSAVGILFIQRTGNKCKCCAFRKVLVRAYCCLLASPA